MKRLIFIAIFSLICSVSIFSQDKFVCPTVKIIPPQYVTKAGDAMTFVVSNIGKTENSKSEYKWNVSIGEIISGQGTPVILVMTTPDMGGTNVTATVKINGLPTGCENEFSEISSIKYICK